MQITMPSAYSNRVIAARAFQHRAELEFSIAGDDGNETDITISADHARALCSMLIAAGYHGVGVPAAQACPCDGCASQDTEMSDGALYAAVSRADRRTRRDAALSDALNGLLSRVAALENAFDMVSRQLGGGANVMEEVDARSGSAITSLVGRLRDLEGRADHMRDAALEMQNRIISTERSLSALRSRIESAYGMVSALTDSVGKLATRLNSAAMEMKG
jgi:hypothetical protein